MNSRFRFWPYTNWWDDLGSALWIFKTHEFTNLKDLWATTFRRTRANSSNLSLQRQQKSSLTFPNPPLDNSRLSYQTSFSVWHWSSNSMFAYNSPEPLVKETTLPECSFHLSSHTPGSTSSKTSFFSSIPAKECTFMKQVLKINRSMWDVLSPIFMLLSSMS